MALKLRLFCLLLCLGAAAAPGQTPAAPPQQVVTRGPLGIPTQLLNQEGQWTTPLPLFSDADVALYTEDVTDPSWVRRNYDNYEQGGSYTVTTLTQYRTPAACRKNQEEWGFADAAHLNACELDISYRIRRVRIEPLQHSITLLWAAMVLQNGDIDPTSVQDQRYFVSFDHLQPGTQEALAKLNALVAKQMASYTRKLNRTQ